jgi:hypothetical protein
MIEERVRQMTADERASLQGVMRPEPARRREPLIAPEGWVSVAVFVLARVAIALAGGRNVGGFALAIAAGVIYGGYRLVAARRSRAQREQFIERYTAQRSGEVARVLQDGRVSVKRVHAVAVVQIEPIEDEGTGYVFDLGDGRVLFLKGQDYDVAGDDEAPWPNTEFEIVRAVTDGTMLDLRCHGTALRPLRVISGADLDPQKGWNEREEVLEMSLDEAVRTVLRNP